MPATVANEPFEIFSADGRLLGIRPRAEVHRLGLWHRSSHVFLFDSAGRMLIAQRSADKDLYPSAWDYSVGEHAQPGESHLAAALRGVHEELGLALTELLPLGEVTPSETVIAASGHIDREFQQAYRGTLSAEQIDQQLQPDPSEVAKIAWQSRAELTTWLDRQPAAFTPWFKRDVQHFQLLKDHAQ